MRKTLLYLIGGIATLTVAMSFVFKEPLKTILKINILHVAGNQALKLDSAIYQNSFGQNFTVSKLRYYLGHIQLQKKNGEIYKSKNYYLIDEENPESKEIILEGIEEGEYSNIEFILGVDSLDNCSGAQTGALDPVNAMFWTWNTGYIFLKLEGHSPQSSSPGHMFEYHIGGFKQPVNCIRQFRFNFSKPLLVQEKAAEKVLLTANVLEILNGSESIDFKKLSSVTDLRNADKIANNYSKMFRLNTINK